LKKVFIIALTLFLFTGTVRNAHANFDPRIKALGIMALYGTVGGALLGTASLAFGTSGRAIAKGASLGLYSGLLFGGYVVISHAMNKRKAEAPEAPQQDYYPDEEESEYDEEEEGYGYEDEDYPEDENYRWKPALHMDQISWRYESNHDGHRPLKANTFTQPLVYFNLINVNF
jgi:hypothetical protein